MRARRRLVSVLSLYLAAVMVLPWPVALATVESGPSTVLTHASTQLEPVVKLRLNAADPHGHAPVGSAPISTMLTEFDDDEGDDCPMLDGFTALPGQDALCPSVAAFNSARRACALIPTAPGHLPLRC